MRKQISNSKQAIYEHEIGYSQSAILFSFVFGGLFLFGGAALGYWLKLWVTGIFPLGGIFTVWQAIKRARDQGPQLKIGRPGIWTVKTGFLPWGQAMPVIKQDIGYRYVASYLVIVNRLNPYKELERIRIEYLDIDIRSLQAYLKEFAPIQM